MARAEGPSVAPLGPARILRRWRRNPVTAACSCAALGGGKRWVVVGPADGAGARIVIARAEGEAQRAAIGAAAGGRVGYFLETDDFARDRAAMEARGVAFLEPPRHEPYGTVAVFRDPWGGKWDLIEPKAAAT